MFKLLSFMKRRRDEKDRESLLARRSKLGSGILSGKKDDDTKQHLVRDTQIEASMSCSTASTDSPWIIDNIVIDGPFTEVDWWEYEGAALDPLESSSDLLNGTPDNTAKRIFRNRGLETWLQVQQAWRSAGDSESLVPREPRVPVISNALRRSITKNLTSRRDFTLQQPIPLSSLVGAYNELWESGYSD